MNPYGGALTDEEATMLGNPMPRGDGFTREHYFGKPYSTPNLGRPVPMPPQPEMLATDPMGAMGGSLPSATPMPTPNPHLQQQQQPGQPVLPPQMFQLNREQIQEFQRLLLEDKMRRERQQMQQQRMGILGGGIGGR